MNFKKLHLCMGALVLIIVHQNTASMAAVAAVDRSNQLVAAQKTSVQSKLVAAGTDASAITEKVYPVADSLSTVTIKTPLEMAIESRNKAAVALLIKQGASLIKKNGAGYTPLAYAWSLQNALPASDARRTELTAIIKILDGAVFKQWIQKKVARLIVLELFLLPFLYGDV